MSAIDPIHFSIEAPKLEDNQLALKANGAWLNLTSAEQPFTLSDTQNIKLYYVPLKPVSEALGMSLREENERFYLAYGSTAIQVPTVMRNGIPFVTDEFLTREFFEEGIDFTVKMSQKANADTLSCHDASTSKGQIWISLRSPRPLAIKGTLGTYLFEAGEYEHDGVSFTYRVARYTADASQKHALVLFQHGGSGRGKDNAKHIDASRIALLEYFVRRKMNVILVLPQATHGSWSFYKYALASLIKDFVESDASIDPKRIFALGASAGGGGTWQLVDAAPNLFAAAMPIAYYAETEEAHIFNACPYEPIHFVSLENLAKVPLLVVAGEADINGIATNPANIRASYEAVVQAGGEAQYDLMPDLDHVGVCTGAFTEEHLDWITSHSRA